MNKYKSYLIMRGYNPQEIALTMERMKVTPKQSKTDKRVYCGKQRDKGEG